ncbi:MAG: OsmC family protein [Desulfovibrio sp.]
MIRTNSLKANYLTKFTNDKFSAKADAPAAKGGADSGFTPFELLEASLATCLNITLRVYAQAHSIDLSGAEASVSLVPDGEGHVFECGVTFQDEPPQEQKTRLLAALKGCPIHGILTKPLRFEFTEG